MSGDPPIPMTISRKDAKSAEMLGFFFPLRLCVFA